MKARSLRGGPSSEERIKEIFPSLSDSTISDLLLMNQFNFEKALDAALTLVTSIDAADGAVVTVSSPLVDERKEEGIIKQPTKSPKAIGRRHTMDSSTAAYFKDSIVGEGKIIRGNQNEIVQGQLSNLTISPTAGLVDNNTSSLVHSPVKSPIQITKQAIPQDIMTSSRGTMMMLPRRFLVVPRFRILEKKDTLQRQNFTVMYSRKHYKLGIKIQEFNSLIQIMLVHPQPTGDTQALLGEASGVKVGDIIVGINGEKFGPWAELKDVMDLLMLSGHFVTIHFERYKKVSASDHLDGSRSSGISLDTSTTKKDYHVIDSYLFPAQMKLFIENSIISKDQTILLDSTLRYLKYRVIKWSSASLAEKIETWQLDSAEDSRNIVEESIISREMSRKTGLYFCL